MIAEIPKGGQVTPISTHGTVLLWKYPQKNLAKNITSDKIKSIIPTFRAFWKNFVCPPIMLLSRTMSRLHWYTAKQRKNSPNNRSLRIFLWKSITAPETTKNLPIEAMIGQGLSFNTKIGLILK